jgi:mRNA interferase MazF
MEKFVKGDIVVIPFPFSDFTQSKRRPALVLATLKGDDLILCQITSKTISDSYSIPVDDSDFLEGSLKQSSNVRQNRIFTVDTKIILYKIGTLKQEKHNKIIDRVIQILTTA